MAHGLTIYSHIPQLHRFPIEITKKLGEFRLSDDEHRILFLNPKRNPDLIWVNANIFTDCKTVDDMVSVFEDYTYAYREKKSKEDQERAQWNYCLFFVFGCIVAPTVMWYAKT
jgi:hypothetical protein